MLMVTHHLNILLIHRPVIQLDANDSDPPDPAFVMKAKIACFQAAWQCSELIASESRNEFCNAMAVTAGGHIVGIVLIMELIRRTKEEAEAASSNPHGKQRGNSNHGPPIDALRGNIVELIKALRRFGRRWDKAADYV
jgi:hypothetical protein